jgi:hypothetical protein
MLAVLGAKRPQHAAWSFVVLAFWGILALPAAETYFLQRGQRREMGDARSPEIPASNSAATASSTLSLGTSTARLK